MLGVTALNNTDVWMVGGEYGGSMTATLSLIWHWDGTQLARVPSPDIGMLRGLSASAAADAWAVGDAGILHWDGVAWQVVPSPATAPLRAVVARAAGDVWAAGDGGVLHWDGAAWSDAGAPAGHYTALALAPDGAVWAVGTDSQGAGLAVRYALYPSFSDVPAAAYFATPVGYLACQGILAGYADGSFQPYNNTTRGQLAKIVVSAAGWAIDTSGGPHFTDVPAGNPFYGFIETAYHHGIISGYANGDGTFSFRWGADVTRAQVSKIIVSAAGWATDTSGGPHFTDVPVDQPFYGFIETAYHHGIISGYADGTFRPGAPATRGQIAKIVYNAVRSGASSGKAPALHKP
jgi:hypothetical protein